MDVVELVNKYGFPIVMAVGMGFIIKYVWEWATKEVKPVISDANTVLIALIDRIRMLDNDLIRLNQKVNTVLHLRGKMIESDRCCSPESKSSGKHIYFCASFDKRCIDCVDLLKVRDKETNAIHAHFSGVTHHTLKGLDPRINSDQLPLNFIDAMKALDKQAWAAAYNAEYLGFKDQ